MAIYQVLGRETITSVATAIGFTSTYLLLNPVYAFIQAVSGNTRFCEDGTTPTSSKGVRLLQDASCEIWGTTALADFLCIDDGGTATLEVIYYGR